ncbi:MAG: hypothetical protein IPJ19_16815 [Planctomycetes bacterium]|nr:hypothetical protein [Planctomycetota bacterium]
MASKLRWVLRIAGWLLVAASLAPSWSSEDLGPGTKTRLTLGLPSAPLYVRETTVIHAGVANVQEAQEVERSSHFEIGSWSMLLLLAGAVVVSASNRRPAPARR